MARRLGRAGVRPQLPTCFQDGLVPPNVPSLPYCEGIKARWFSGEVALEPMVHPGRGARVVFEELMTLIQAHGLGFQSFGTLVDRLPAGRTSLTGPSC